MSIVVCGVGNVSAGFIADIKRICKDHPEIIVINAGDNYPAPTDYTKNNDSWNVTRRKQIRNSHPWKREKNGWK